MRQEQVKTTSPCQEYITKLMTSLPELATSGDLVKAGVYRNEQAAYSARRRGNCPPYIRIPSRGIVYPRDGVCSYIQKHCVETKFGMDVR